MVNATFSIDDSRLRRPRRSTDLTRRAARLGHAERLPAASGKLLSAAAGRQQEQLPAFAPLLEEVELDGWSSHPQMLSGNFHDWMLLDGGRLLVMAGQAVGGELCDPIETALVAQAAWTAVRAHAHHTHDAGRLLSLAARTLWTNPAMNQQAQLALGLIDAVGGSASVAIAGECLAWRVRAATWEQFACDEPPLGAETNYAYGSHQWAMSLRERLLLVADTVAHRPAKLVASVAADFSRQGAEVHRRMTATEALGIVRRRYERAAADDVLASASVVAVRRR